MDKFIAVITGPGGSGKSTVTQKVVDEIPSCVNIKVDDVKHFISFKDFDYEDNPKGIKQWRLLGNNLGLLAKNFQKNGYRVIINGYLNEPAWEELEKQIRLTHKILILPEVETVIQRDSKRPKDRLDEATIRRHYQYFSDGKYFGDFTKVDSTHMSVEQTAERVLEIIGKNWGEL